MGAVEQGRGWSKLGGKNLRPSLALKFLRGQNSRMFVERVQGGMSFRLVVLWGLLENLFTVQSQESVVIRSQVITAAVVLDNSFFGQTSGGSIFDGRARYQFECHNATATGTATVEINFGAGFRTMKTIDLTDAARTPYTIEADIVAIKVTPSQEMILAVSAERA